MEVDGEYVYRIKTQIKKYKEQKLHIETLFEDIQDNEEKVGTDITENKTDAERIGKVWGKFFENAALSSEVSPAKKKQSTQAMPAKRLLLHGACMDGDVELLSVLYSQGTGDGEEIDVDECDLNGNTALHVATQHGHIACVQFLLETCPDHESN